MYIVGEIVQVRVRGQWYDAEVLEIGSTSAYVYVLDLRVRKNVANADIR